MKNIAAVFVALVLFPAVSSAAPTTAASAATFGEAPGSRIYAVNGTVLVSQGQQPAHRVIDNEPIASGSMIDTGDKSAALLKFEDGQVVTMQANSTFNVREYHYDAKKIENSNIIFSMFRGGMRFVTGLIGQRNKQAFRLSTPNATIGIRGTEFMVTMAGKSMYSQVLTGKVVMTNGAGVLVVSAGQSAVVASSSALASLVPASAIPAGTFSELLSIPVQPSAIPALAPEPAPEPAPAAPAPAAASIPDALPDASGASAATGTAADVAGTSIGVAGVAVAALAGSDSDSTPAVPPPVAPEADLQESPEPAKAADEKAMGTNSRSGFGVTGKIGTLGYGFELNLGISDSVSARLGLNAFSYKYNANSNSVNYDFKLQLQTVSALADWYPFEGGFRTSAGVLYDNNKIDLNAKPTSGSYIINGKTYTSSQIGTMQGTLSFSKIAPYIGIGWGNPVAKNKGWGLVTDIGVLYQGKPKIDLLLTCTDPLVCTQLQTDATAENAKLQNDLSSFKWWPVASIGISYQW